jgi:tRNA A-37 threonylcarbamoyl transferase component Bud32
VYFVNWQREVTVEEWSGQKVVVKRNKSTKEFHEFLIIYAYSLISMLLVHPSAPQALSETMRNEGRSMRNALKNIGISTPELISISNADLVEEYIEGGDLYRALASGGDSALANAAGRLTGRFHRAGYAFVDNKAQNYLVRGDSLVRTDLGFIKKSSSSYSRSMDIGSFLASVMDIGSYRQVEKAFYDGYLSETGSGFTYLSLIIRNALSLGFSSDTKATFRNMLLNSSRLTIV